MVASDKPRRQPRTTKWSRRLQDAPERPGPMRSGLGALARSRRRIVDRATGTGLDFSSMNRMLRRLRAEQQARRLCHVPACFTSYADLRREAAEARPSPPPALPGFGDMPPLVRLGDDEGDSDSDDEDAPDDNDDGFRTPPPDANRPNREWGPTTGLMPPEMCRAPIAPGKRR